MSTQETNPKTEVNTLVEQMTKSEDGKWELPEGEHNPYLVEAAMSERRRRDTQSAYTTTTQTLKALEAENELLASGWAEQFTSSLPAEQQAELEQLKKDDPEAWRVKINEFEKQRGDEFQEKRKEIQTKAQGESELEFRGRILEEYNTNNPDHAITDDSIKNDIPPRITRKLEEGKISFPDFIKEASEFLHKGKVVGDANTPPPKNVNLNDAAGGSHASNEAKNVDSATQYKNEIF